MRFTRLLIAATLLGGCTVLPVDVPIAAQAQAVKFLRMHGVIPLAGTDCVIKGVEVKSVDPAVGFSAIGRVNGEIIAFDSVPAGVELILMIEMDGCTDREVRLTPINNSDGTYVIPGALFPVPSPVPASPSPAPNTSPSALVMVKMKGAITFSACGVLSGSDIQLSSMDATVPFFAKAKIVGTSYLFDAVPVGVKMEATIKIAGCPPRTARISARADSGASETTVDLDENNLTEAKGEEPSPEPSERPSPTPEPTVYTPPAESTSSGSNCHYVNGYRRKNGTYVSGYTRCY